MSAIMGTRFIDRVGMVGLRTITTSAPRGWGTHLGYGKKTKYLTIASKTVRVPGVYPDPSVAIVRANNAFRIIRAGLIGLAAYLIIGDIAKALEKKEET